MEVMLSLSFLSLSLLLSLHAKSARVLIPKAHPEPRPPYPVCLAGPRLADQDSRYPSRRAVIYY